MQPGEIEGKVVSERYYDGVQLADELGILGKEVRVRVADERIKFKIEATSPQLYVCEVCGYTSVYKGLYRDTGTGLRCIGEHLHIKGECGHQLEDIPVTVVYTKVSHTFCTLECAIEAMQAIVDN
jgi:hypothetical protein